MVLLAPMEGLLDFVLRDVVVADGAELIPDDDDVAEFSGDEVIVLNCRPGFAVWRFVFSETSETSSMPRAMKSW